MHTIFRGLLSLHVLRLRLLWTGLLLSAPMATQAGTNFYVSPAGNDHNPGTMAAPFRTIQAAINNATTGDAVTLEDGTYADNGNRDIDFSGKNVTLNSENGPDKTIIDCGSVAKDVHSAFLLRSMESVTINGLTIKNSLANRNIRGAIRIDRECTVRLNHCIFTANTYAAVSNSGTAILTDCTFKENTGCSVITSGTARLIGCTITLTYQGNNSEEQNGGLFVAGGTADVTNCTISDNGTCGIFTMGKTTLTKCIINTNFFGGVVNQSSDLSLVNCTIDHNDSNGLHNRGTVNLLNCTVSGNTAHTSSNEGGGIDNESGTAVLTNCTLAENKAGSGGAVSNHGKMTLTNCNLIRNSTLPRTPVRRPTTNRVSKSMGGGVYNMGELALQYCTLYGNSIQGDAQGGALENRGKARLTNCILWGNTAPDAEAISVSMFGNPLTITMHCDIQGGLNGSDKNVNNIKADPLFVDADHADLHLRAGSPCIGVGMALDIAVPAIDMDGKKRANPPSIGAYEGAKK